MKKLVKNRTKKTGLPAGSMVYVGDKKTPAPRISIFDYDRNTCQELVDVPVADCAKYIDPSTTTWINVDGVDHVEIVRALGEQFKIHSLVMEDVVNTTQRPKRTVYGEYLYLVMKMLYVNNGKLCAEQVSMILGNNFLISFQEEPEHDVFDKVRDSLRKGVASLRGGGPDYLTYALIDTIVDHYFIILEELGERLELIEAELVQDPKPAILANIYELKRDLLYIRRSIWPLREVLSGLDRGEVALIKPSTALYLRDVYDHVVEVIEVLEMFREMASSMVEIYLSSVNNKISQVMKLLGVVATIFMPLTLISSIYGMNFKHMPELEWQLGYPMVLLFMLLIAVLMLLHFRRKSWLD